MNDLKKSVDRLERAYLAGLDEELREDVRTVLDALSAQPDAASGGDARARFEAWYLTLPNPSPLTKSGVRDAYTWASPDSAWRGWQAALAARHPVGVEPVEYQVRGPRNTKWEPCDRELHESAHKADGVETRALYTAPPAPAAVPVDWGDPIYGVAGGDA